MLRGMAIEMVMFDCNTDYAFMQYTMCIAYQYFITCSQYSLGVLNKF